MLGDIFSGPPLFNAVRLQVELEKLKLSEMTCREALASVAKIIYSVHDDVKDKEFELELRLMIVHISDELLKIN